MTMNESTPMNGASRDSAPEPAENQDMNAGAPGTDNVVQGDRVAELEAERADLKERLLRSLADMENLRRRTERDVADARTYAVTSFARDMLTVADNIRRALESAPSPQDDTKALLEGLELTERDLLKTLERHGVKRVEPQGLKFDPNMHQAMFEIPNPDVPAGTVLQVVQTGFAIGERVLRPALVGVAKGGPKANPSPAGVSGDQPDPEAAADRA
jgi:molecular chaperone GrpE